MMPRELTLSDIVSNSLQIIKEILQTSKTIKCKVFDQESYEAWNGGGGRRSCGKGRGMNFFFLILVNILF